MSPANRPGYLAPGAPPIGTQSRDSSGAPRHATGCAVNSGDPRHRHGVGGFWCDRCAQSSPSRRIESAIRSIEKVSGRVT